MIDTIKQQAGGSALDIKPSLGGAVKPAYLQMWIGDQLIEDVELDYTLMENATQKQHYQEQIASVLLTMHTGKVVRSGHWPVFYVIQESKM